MRHPPEVIDEAHQGVADVGVGGSKTGENPARPRVTDSRWREN